MNLSIKTWIIPGVIQKFSSQYADENAKDVHTLGYVKQEARPAKHS